MLAALPAPTPYDYIQEASQVGLTWFQILTGQNTAPVIPAGQTATIAADVSTPLLIVLGLVAVAVVLVFTLKR